MAEPELVPPAVAVEGELYELCPHCRNGRQRKLCGMCRQLGFVRYAPKKDVERAKKLASAVEAIRDVFADDKAEDDRIARDMDDWRRDP